MTQLRPDAVRQQIARGATDPVYLLAGDDEHEKSALALAFGEMVEEGLRAFNVERLYATDKAMTALQVTEAARTLPMLAPRRIVIVLSAEKLLAPKKGKGAVETDGDDGAASDLEPLMDYLQDPAPTTSLVFVFSAADGEPDAIPIAKNLRITKALAKVGTLVVCSGLDGGKDLSRWIVERAKAAGLEIDRQAVMRVIELASRDPVRIRADVEKLLLFASGAGRITMDHVAAIAGTPLHHGDDWALVNAIEHRDLPKALRELDAALDNGGSPFQILGQLGWMVRTKTWFHTRRLPAAVEALFRTDVAMKSSGGDPRVLLERLIVELCG